MPRPLRLVCHDDTVEIGGWRNGQGEKGRGQTGVKIFCYRTDAQDRGKSKDMG
jgi:hypothetical protein